MNFVIYSDNFVTIGSYSDFTFVVRNPIKGSFKQARKGTNILL